MAFPAFREDEHVEVQADWLALLLLSVCKPVSLLEPSSSPVSLVELSSSPDALLYTDDTEDANARCTSVAQLDSKLPSGDGDTTIGNSLSVGSTGLRLEDPASDFLRIL